MQNPHQLHETVSSRFGSEIFSVFPPGDMILSLIDKVHQILVAPRWLAKSWKVEITRLWHLALHKEPPSKAGKVLHSQPDLPHERSNLLATGVPPNVEVPIESGIIY